ncbi:MAG: hypothetical protein ABS44_11745 [Chryseobacterium sp. SCN 40-13]|nr:MAG: hypothetical protein ABS44_11745 [Chryseobacterium sp. SCN 40-13]
MSLLNTGRRFKRTPTELVDGLTIYCYQKRKQGERLYKIAKEIGKDHSTVMYHLKRYEDLMSIDKKFQRTEKEFIELEFIEKYKKLESNESTIH